MVQNTETVASLQRTVILFQAVPSEILTRFPKAVRLRSYRRRSAGGGWKQRLHRGS